MKLALGLFLVTLFAAVALAAAPQKAILVSYPNDTPTSVLDEAKDAIRKAGGVITHEYNLIKAFAAKAPANVLETVQTLGTENNVLIEEDEMVHANES